MSQNDELRARSGSVDSADPLVDFLYHLIRDHLPAGVVEGVMQNHVFPEKTGLQHLEAVEGREHTSQFCNGYVARYAQDLADRLRKAQPKGPGPLSIAFCSEELREVVNAASTLGTLRCVFLSPTLYTALCRVPSELFQRETSRERLALGLMGYWHGVPVIQKAHMESDWVLA